MCRGCAGVVRQQGLQEAGCQSKQCFSSRLWKDSEVSVQSWIFPRMQIMILSWLVSDFEIPLYLNAQSISYGHSSNVLPLAQTVPSNTQLFLWPSKTDTELIKRKEKVRNRKGFWTHNKQKWIIDQICDRSERFLIALTHVVSRDFATSLGSNLQPTHLVLGMHSQQSTTMKAVRKDSAETTAHYKLRCFLSVYKGFWFYRNRIA